MPKRIKKITSAEGNLLEPYWEFYVEMKATRDTGMYGERRTKACIYVSTN